MTKSEMLELLNNGNKVTHSSFKDNEWCEKVNGIVCFEDRLKIYYTDFIKWINKYNHFNNGWKLI